MTWVAELPLTWVIDGNRVQGRLAIGMPELVDRGSEGEGEATCTIALDGLQRPTKIHGEGRFHALLMGLRYLDSMLRDFAAKGVRAVFPGENDDPESATESLLRMFRRLE